LLIRPVNNDRSNKPEQHTPLFANKKENPMSNAVDFVQIGQYAKQFSRLTPEKEALLAEEGLKLIPYLPEVTDKFYVNLQNVTKAAPYIEGKIDYLKQTHLTWLKSVFSGQYGQPYVETMYRVGYIHVQVDLPVEFMSGGITLITNELITIASIVYKDDPEKCIEVLSAINAVFGFSLLVMQASYQASVSEVLDRFLSITGMSKVLFDNLATAYDASASKS